VSWRRIWALNLRQLYVMRRSFARVTELFYWPFVDLFFFGFLSLYLARREGAAGIVAVLLSALILWDMFFRVQHGISISFLMELWTRNLVNLFVTPVTMPEFLAAMMVWGLIKISITATLMTTLAYVLYRFNLFTLGLSLVPLAVALIVFAWAVGTVVTALILRYGQSVEVLAWSLPFLFQPFGAVFFPVSVYPAWLQRPLQLQPLPHIFEAARALVAGRPLPLDRVGWAFLLDAVYLAAAFAFFAYMFTLARRRGLLLKVQE
jgi:ABC-2 type transport system permease protein